MRRRIKAVLSAAAALVVAGATVAVGLQQAAQDELGRPATCDDWNRAFDFAETQPEVEWFMASASGYVPPAAVGTRLLGDCAAGQCTIQPQGCAEKFSYTFERGAPTGVGWRLTRFKGPGYAAVSWRALAASNPSNARFYGSWGELTTACLAQFTAAQCRALAATLGSVCWKRGAQVCRNGRLFGPGLGGVTCSGGTCTAATCTVQAGDVPYPCDVNAGLDPDTASTAVLPSNQELDP